MTKVKLYLEGLGPLDLEEDNPESLTKILSSLAKNFKSPLIEETNLDTNITNLPTVNEFKEYILSKPDFAHDSVELMYKFFGRKIKSKEEPSLFLSFNNKIRKARKQIEKEYNIKWDTTERKSYDRYTHPIVYKR